MEEIGQSTTLNPTPGYVMKTRILKSNNTLPGTKVFINICHDPQVPKPSQDFEPSIVFPLIVDNQWEIPIIVSREKEVKDKQGHISLCYDCCINDICFRWCSINSDLKSILNEWCLEAVELLYSIVVDRQYTVPKMLSKGSLSQTEIRQKELTDDGLVKRIDELKKNETLGLIEELNDPMDVDSVDIFNNTPAKKPLIEELDSIPSKTSVNNDLRPFKKPIQIDYKVSFQKLNDNTGKYTVVTKIESNLPYEAMNLWFENSYLTITSTQPQFLFDVNTNTPHLKIPLSHKPINFKSFYVNKDLLVFS